jgi:cohesin loading factor subunit SCC2
MNSVEVEKHVLPYVLVLHAFCLVDPTLCAPASNPSQFVMTLQPYLKTQVRTNLKSCILADCSIFMHRVLNCMN